MDTKLKNNRKFRILIIAAAIMIAVAANLCIFPWLQNNTENRASEVLTDSDNIDRTYIDTLYHGTYVLYTEIQPDQVQNKTTLFMDFSEDGSEGDFDYILQWNEEFEYIRSQVDYYVTNGTGEEINTDTPLKDVLSDQFDAAADTENWRDYDSIFVLSFDEEGKLSVSVKKEGKVSADVLIKEFLQSDRENEIRATAAGYAVPFIPPKNYQVVYAIPYNSEAFTEDDYYTSSYYFVATSGGMEVYCITLLILAVFVCLMCSRRLWKNETLPDYLPRHRYMEAGGIGLIALIAMFDLYIQTICDFPYTVRTGFSKVNVIDVLKAGGVLTLIFTVAVLTVLCLYPVMIVGPKEYVKQYSFIYQIFPWICKKWNAFADEVSHIDFSDKTTKTILKLVVINFLILAVLMCMWMFGIVGLIIYSLVLFYLLKKYYDRIRKDYDVLMRGVQRIAEGDLDTVITEDIGVFEPFKEQLTEIRTGFKKAVNEEVKSQRMKTELITNVSHDLKTPLTAIITYVKLLQEPGVTQEQRKEYLETLDRKSLRLKALIEDLFEVSKANSQNVTLDIRDVDIVSMVKQVEFEMEDKLADAGLDVRMSLPEEKVIVPLDSQKTFRIFENLFGNIAKYALSGTRVYVNGFTAKDEVTIILKNITAQELSVSGEELTERFVRGDVSRNTEGSGLGLAIAKSFTELQGGKFRIELDGDLFKVVLTWKVKQESGNHNNSGDTVTAGEKEKQPL